MSLRKDLLCASVSPSVERMPRFPHQELLEE